MRRFHRSETRILKELKSYRNKQKALKKAVKAVDNEMEKIMRKDIRKNEFRLAVLEIARYAEVNGIRGIKLNAYIKEYFCHARKRMMCNGGYNGIKDIERCLGSRMYARLKIGITNNKSMDTKDYVLGKFSKEQREVLDEVYDKVGNLLEDFVHCDIARLKQIYNSMNKKNDL